MVVLAISAMMACLACIKSDKLRSVTSLPSAARMVSSPDAMAALMAARSDVVNDAMPPILAVAVCKTVQRLHYFRRLPNTGQAMVGWVPSMYGGTSLMAVSVPSLLLTTSNSRPPTFPEFTPK